MTEVINEGTDQYRRPPSTQNGNTADPSAQHVQETVDGVGLVPNVVGPDQTPPTDGETATGAWNSGQNIDGWHPAE